MTEGLKEFAEWLDAKNLSIGTIKQYLTYYQLLEKKMGDDLTQEFVIQFINRHPSKVTRAFLKNLFEFYEITELKIPKLKGRVQQKKKRTISFRERKILRRVLYKRRWKYGLMFDLSYRCALRREEVIKINIKDFEIEEWSEDQSRSCKLKIYGKGRRERYVAVPPNLMKRIINWVQERGINTQKTLFKIKKETWHKAFHKSVKENLRHHYTLHDLRRSRATLWLEQGVDINRVRMRLGHADISTTQRYINLDEKKEFDLWAKEDHI